MIRLVPLITAATLLLSPAAAVAHTLPDGPLALAAALVEPVRVTPTSEQFEAMLTGARLAHDYATTAGWTDHCPAGQLREIHANLDEQAASYGYETSVGGLSWYTECRWAINAAYTADPATVCSISAHEEAHGIRGDAWHSTDLDSPVADRPPSFPPCITRSRTETLTVSAARRALRAQLSHPRRWRIWASYQLDVVELVARKRRTGTLRFWTAARRPDGTIRVLRAR